MSSRGKKKQEQKVVKAIDSMTDAELKKLMRRTTPEQYRNAFDACLRHKPELVERLDRCVATMSATWTRQRVCSGAMEITEPNRKNGRT